jgi:hypothetical protein
METCCPEVSLRGQASITKTPIEKVNLLDSKGVWEGNCRSLGFARDDKGEGCALMWIRCWMG